MGSKAGVVVGPTRQRYIDDILHLSVGSTKERMAVIYCASVEGIILPRLYVYPAPKHTVYDPLLGYSLHTKRMDGFKYYFCIHRPFR